MKQFPEMGVSITPSHNYQNTDKYFQNLANTNEIYLFTDLASSGNPFGAKSKGKV